MNNNAIIKVKNIQKSFGDHKVLNDISFNLFQGQTMVVIGPSGSGKTVLFRCLTGLEKVDGGEIEIAGNLVFKNGLVMPEAELNRFRAEVGMVFQSFNLFPHLTTVENVMVGPINVRKMRREEARSLAMRLLKKVGLEDKADSHPAILSGGQKQRAAIARSLAMQPKVMLFDEPTSSLDPDLVEEVLQVMKNLSREGMTMIVNTHQMNFARDVADTVAVLSDGRLSKIGAPEEVL